MNTGQSVAAANQAADYRIQQYQYVNCTPPYHACQPTTEDAVDTTKLVKDSKTPTIYHPNPFNPNGGALEWTSNELILHDVNLRRLARVRPLDCSLTQMIKLNPEPQL